jgi:hypothetical protein
VAFCGVDDLTEIAYLSLCEAGLELATVMDEGEGGRFINLPVVSLEVGVRAADNAPFVITSLPRADQLKARLLQLGVTEQNILAPSYSYEDVLLGRSGDRSYEPET